jgi:hypothetical protein
MKSRQKPGCNQKNPERDDVTALLPMRNEQKLHRYIFLEGKGRNGAGYENRSHPTNLRTIRALYFARDPLSRVQQCNMNTVLPIKTAPRGSAFRVQHTLSVLHPENGYFASCVAVLHFERGR